MVCLLGFGIAFDPQEFTWSSFPGILLHPPEYLGTSVHGPVRGRGRVRGGVSDWCGPSQSSIPLLWLGEYCNGHVDRGFCAKRNLCHGGNSCAKVCS